MSPEAKKRLEAGEVEEKVRGNWNNPVEFFLAILAYAVGLANVWR